ncbi:MAG: hypothetical protein IT372_34955, partial [Polyangiaceae bacterium]|nr:hypothetical protein [Polyangiaceae bacterium]
PLVDALYPPDLLAVLRLDAAVLQRDGWAQPPGTRWLSYRRPRRPLPAGSAHEHAGHPDTVLLALSPAPGDVLPRITEALGRMEALHRALVDHSDLGDGVGPAPSLSGKDAAGAPLWGHAHAWLLPVTLDSGTPGAASPADLRPIAHVLVHARMGLDARALAAFDRLRKVYGPDLPACAVSILRAGALADFAPQVPVVRRARAWRSVTPFVPPRHLKARGANALEGQVQAELRSRGLPEAVLVAVELEDGGHAPASEFWPLWLRRSPGGAPPAAEADPATEPGAGAIPSPRLATRWRHFQRERAKRDQAPPVPAGLGLRLVFAEPVQGPIALGYASHFGLGLMEPDEG